MPAGIWNCKTGAAAGNLADRNDDNFDSEMLLMQVRTPGLPSASMMFVLQVFASFV
jgi:hypothetical protein